MTFSALSWKLPLTSQTIMEPSREPEANKAEET